MRVVCYAINGSGSGHLMRLTAIARQLRRRCAEGSSSTSTITPLEIVFLTSSEATHLLFAEDFASFKFPSRETLQKSGINTASFTEMIKRWTAQTLKLLRPDLLLVDTFPAGYYDELLENLVWCRHTAVIHRPLKFDNLDKTSFYQALARYDSVIVPEEELSAEACVPLEIAEKIAYFGAVMRRDKAELFDREEARRRLNVKDEDFLVYVSAGGGGDADAEERIRYIYDCLYRQSGVKLVIGAGALYRGRRIYAPDVIWLANENAFELMPGFDVAISAAGYNSFYELLYAGVPSVFIPQHKWADDQLQRARRAEAAGAGIVFKELPEASELENLIEGWRDPETRRLVSQKAQNFVPINYASHIAKFLFEKLSSG